MDGWDIGIFAVAAYIAVSSLVRLMIARRNALIAQLQSQTKQPKARETKPDKRGKAA